MEAARPVWMYHPQEGARLFPCSRDIPPGWYESPGEARAAQDQRALAEPPKPLRLKK